MAGWKVHSWVLMGNHYHLMIETPEGNLVEEMKWFQNTYTRRLNCRHTSWGRLFGDRYKAVVVDGITPEHYCTLADYIHLNPARARLVKPGDGQSLLDYPWSSISSGYALPPGKRPKWLMVAEGLRAFGYADTASSRRRFIEKLEKKAREDESCGVPAVRPDADQRISNLRRGWYWGDEQFAEGLLKLGEKALSKPKSRTYRSSREKMMHGIKRAEDLLAQGMAKFGIRNRDLKETKGSDPRKIEIAAAIRSETTVRLAWIAEKLWMRSAANVGEHLRRRQRPVK